MKWLDEHKLSFWRRPKFGSAYAFPISNCRQLSSARILAHRRRFWRIYRIPEFRKCVILLCRFLICRCQIIKRWHARNSEAKSFVFAKVQVGNVWTKSTSRQCLKYRISMRKTSFEVLTNKRNRRFIFDSCKMSGNWLFPLVNKEPFLGENLPQRHPPLTTIEDLV